MTRIGVYGLDEDNLSGGLKAIRDGIAKALGVDDRDASMGGAIAWKVSQEKFDPSLRGRQRYGIRIRIDLTDQPESHSLTPAVLVGDEPLAEHQALPDKGFSCRLKA
jgi:hypothetical protein